MTREEALRIIEDCVHLAEYVDSIYVDCVDIEALRIAIKALYAEPERKKGHWIEDAETYYRAVNEKGGGVNEDTPFFVDDIACSECLAMFSVIDNCTEDFNFCPNCGADMRGGENATD